MAVRVTMMLLPATVFIPGTVSKDTTSSEVEPAVPPTPDNGLWWFLVPVLLITLVGIIVFIWMFFKKCVSPQLEEVPVTFNSGIEMISFHTNHEIPVEQNEENAAAI